jgi:hypothetical protein
MAKKFVVKNQDGKFSKGKSSSRSWVDNVWDAKLYARRCDASNSSGVQEDGGFVVQVEVRVKEDK